MVKKESLTLIVLVIVNKLLIKKIIYLFIKTYKLKTYRFKISIYEVSNGVRVHLYLIDKQYNYKNCFIKFNYSLLL